jgi:hypothetical protein
MLASEEVAAFLNGLSALWHPAAIQGATAPPRIDSPYDHEQPTAGHLYAVPDSPPLVLPEDWEDRVSECGAAVFRATPDRKTTLENLRAAVSRLPRQSDAAPLVDADDPIARPFFGIGFGYMMIESLFEAMEHQPALATADFWQAVQQAVKAIDNPERAGFRRHLQLAADLLLAAREVVYPVEIYLVDIWLLGEQTQGFEYCASEEFARNLVAPASLLEQFGRERADLLAALRAGVEAGHVEVCGGPYFEREDPLFALESRLWNLTRGLAVYKELLGRDIGVFARQRAAASVHLPLLLNSVGLRRAMLLAFDQSSLPTYRTTVINWATPDGKQVEAFTRVPYSASEPQTFFHWAHYLHQTIAQDHAATIALLHRDPAAPWYDDLHELMKFAPVFGRWTTLSKYFDQVLAGEYASAASADDFHADYLTVRTDAHVDKPVSSFAEHLRTRRRLDTVRTLLALNRALTGRATDPGLEVRLGRLEEEVENPQDGADSQLAADERQAAMVVADRLLAHASGANPGYLVLNPCSFARRVAITLEDVADPLPVAGAIKASQFDGNIAQVVVEVPPLGFAWLPADGPAGGSVPAARMRLADERHVRNEFFEAEIDLTTGGLKAFRDHRTRINRIAQQLIFNPGSKMVADQIQVNSNGPALGEIVAEGKIVDEYNEPLAGYRQRFRAWLGRPVLELRIDITPHHEPKGYPWHAYYGARFAWRDERALLLRGLNGTGYTTSHTRPETPDYLELRSGRQSTVLLPGGLPFHQRHGARMLDTLLVVEGETARSFDLGLAIDREYPMQTALGMWTPVVLVPTKKGPPHVGATGWLFHGDLPNVVLTSMLPAEDGADAVIARFLECTQYTSQAELRCVRDPRRAFLLDGRGNHLQEVSTSGDSVIFEVPAGDLIHLRIEFS